LGITISFKKWSLVHQSEVEDGGKMEIGAEFQIQFDFAFSSGRYYK